MLLALPIPLHVLSVRHRLKMRRVAATLIAASVIKFQARRNRAVCKFVSDNISACLLTARTPVRQLDLTVALMRSALPHPTIVWAALLEHSVQTIRDRLGLTTHPLTVIGG
jgi:hypothetical protein